MKNYIQLNEHYLMPKYTLLWSSNSTGREKKNKDEGTRERIKEEI